MIIPAEEQREFEDYAKALLADPTSQIHKRLNAEFDIGQIDFDPSEIEFDNNALLISYINGETTPELDDVWINSTMSHFQAFSQKHKGNTQDEQIDLKDAVPLNSMNTSTSFLTRNLLNFLNQHLGITKSK